MNLRGIYSGVKITLNPHNGIGYQAQQTEETSVAFIL